MSNRWLAFLLVVAAFSMPSQAYAEGGISDVTKTLTDTVKKTVNNTVFPERNEDNSSQVKSVPAEREKPALKDPEKTEKASIDIDVPLVNAEASISADSLKVKIADAEAEVTTKAPAVKVNTPSANAQVSADSQAIKVETPLAQTDVSVKDPGLNVTTSLVNTEISADSQAIKVETPLAQADVSIKDPGLTVKSSLVNTEIFADSQAIKVGTPLAQADVSAHKQDVKITTPLLKTEKELESPAFKEQTPTGNTDTPLVPKDEQMENPKSPVLPPAFSGKKDEVPLVEPPAYKEQESPLEPIFKNESAVKKAIENRGKIPGNPISFSGNIGQGMPSQDLTGKADTRGEESLIPFDNKNMVLPGNPPSLLTGSTNGQAASCTTIIGYNTGLSSVGILLTMTQLEHSLTNKVIQESKFYYDQWLNAPPTQPPQSTFFLQTIKYTI